MGADGIDDPGDTGPLGPPPEPPDNPWLGAEPQAPPTAPPAAPPPSPPRPPGRPHGPTHGQIQRRRLAALAVILGVAALVASVVLGRGEEEGSPAPVPEDAAKAVKGLSVPEKIDTVLAVGFSGTAAPEPAPTQGAVVVSRGNWPGAAQGPALLRQIHESGDGGGRVAPLVIGLQEGGPYRAYDDLPPAARQLDIGAQNDPALAESSSAEGAKALKKAGFDLNLAPVADVATLDSPIADRAYGDSPELVSAMTAAAIRGCTAAGLLCAPAHFPGEGAANADPGDGPATVGLDVDGLRDRDVAPFEAAFAAKAPAVVLSHAFYAAYDSVTPGSMTAPIVTDLLREELRFKGAAITDDLSAGAIRGGEGAGDASVLALAAGADLLLVSDPGDAAAARAALVKAVEDGSISTARLDEAAGRVLALKRAAGIDISP